MAQQSIGLLFPFVNSQKIGVFKESTTTLQALQSDLISLMTTRRGGRVMNSQLFSPLFDHLFEQLDEVSMDLITTEVKAKVAQFIPQITVLSLIFNNDPANNLIAITINYSINSFFGTTHSITINIPATQ